MLLILGDRNHPFARVLPQAALNKPRETLLQSEFRLLYADQRSFTIVHANIAYNRFRYPILLPPGSGR